LQKSLHMRYDDIFFIYVIQICFLAYIQRAFVIEVQSMAFTWARKAELAAVYLD